MTDQKRVALYVGDLSATVTESTLFDLFNHIGPVASTRVVRDRRTRISLGYAYVNFHNPDDAKRAITDMNLTSIKGQPCRVMWSERDPEKRVSGKGNVIVKNLNVAWDDKTLLEAFSTFGKIVSSKVVRGKDRKGLGYGYVRFDKEEEADKAIAHVNGIVLGDTRVTVEKFVPKKLRPWTNVYTKHVPEGFSEEKLCDLFCSKRVEEVVKRKHSEMLAVFEAKKKALEAKGDTETASKLQAPKLNVPVEVETSRYWEHPFGTSACVRFKEPEHAQSVVEVFDGYKFTDEDLAHITSETGGEEKDGTEADESEEKQPLFVCRALTKFERIAARKRQRVESGRVPLANLFVKHLPEGFEDTGLRDAFKEFGSIVSAKVARDKESGASRGFGFVQYKNVADANVAISSMNGTSKLGGAKPLYVARFEAKDRRHRRTRHPFRQPQRPEPFIRGQFAPATGQQWPGMPLMAGRSMVPPPFQAPAGFQRPIPPYGAPPMMAFPQMAAQMPAMARGFGMQQLPTASGQFMASATAAAGQSASVHSRPIVGSVGIGAGSVRHPSAVATHPPSAPALSASGVHSQPATEGGLSSSHVAGGLSSAMMREQAPPLTSAQLEGAKPPERKRMIGERLFPRIQEVEPRLAGKITGMLLEMENAELLSLLSDSAQLLKKINEALAVLKEHQMRQSAKNSGKNLSSAGQQSSAPH